MPIQQPTRQLRTVVNQYCGSFFHVCTTILKSMRALLPWNDRPSSIDSKISPMPKRPITATRKSKPRMSSWNPKVSRNWPVTVSMPTAASAKPNIIAVRVFHGEPLPMPIKLQKVRK